MQTEMVTKDLVFRMRLDEKDRERLDRLAEHYSAPVATVVRILVKERDDEVAQQSPTAACAQQLWNAKSAFDTALRADNIDETIMGDVIRSFVQLEEMLLRAGFGAGVDEHRKVQGTIRAADSVASPKAGRKAEVMRNAKIGAARRSPTAKK